MAQNKIGNYIHYNWNNYLKYGTLMANSSGATDFGGTLQRAREVILEQQQRATENLRNAFKDTVVSQDDIDQLCLVANSLITLQPDLAAAQSQGILEAEGISEEEYKNSLKELLNAAKPMDYNDNIDISKTGNILNNAVTIGQTNLKKYSRAGEYFVKLSTLVNYYNSCIKAYHDVLNNEEISPGDIKKIENQLNILNQLYSQLWIESAKNAGISKIAFNDGKTKNFKNVVPVKNHKENIDLLTNFENATKNISKILTVNKNLNALKGAHLENIIGIAGLMLGGMQIQEAIDAIGKDLSLNAQNRIYMTGDKQTNAKLNLKNIAFNLQDDNFNIQGEPKSSQKIDISISINNKNYDISAKNYNPNFPQFHGISLVSGSSLLTILAEDNAYINFTNHYLNLATYHEGGRLPYHNLRYELNKALSLTVLYFALAGKTADRQEKVPNILIVHNNSDGTTHGYTFKTLSEKIIQSFYGLNNPLITIKPDLNNLHFQNNFEGGIFNSYNLAQKRIAKTLSEVHKTKIKASLNTDFSKKLLGN